MQTSSLAAEHVIDLGRPDTNSSDSSTVSPSSTQNSFEAKPCCSCERIVYITAASYAVLSGTSLVLGSIAWGLCDSQNLNCSQDLQQAAKIVTGIGLGMTGVGLCSTGIIVCKIKSLARNILERPIFIM